MSVFRVNRTKDYTVMSNYPLKDKELSLKSKGLLSMMLSLPDEWNYSIKVLATICKEGVDAIRTALKELENACYITRERLRDNDGRIGETEYTIYEKPQPRLDNPIVAINLHKSPKLENPILENPIQLNTKKSSIYQSNPYQSNTENQEYKTDRITYKNLIMRNIEYDIIVEQYGGRLT